MRTVSMVGVRSPFVRQGIAKGLKRPFLLQFHLFDTPVKNFLTVNQ